MSGHRHFIAAIVTLRFAFPDAITIMVSVGAPYFLTASAMRKPPRSTDYHPDRGEDRDPLERLGRYICFCVGTVAAVLCTLIAAVALVGIVRFFRHARH